LNRILALKDLGFPLEQIAQLLENKLSLEQLQGMLQLKQTQTQLMIDSGTCSSASLDERQCLSHYRATSSASPAPWRTYASEPICH
jgi:DNA-binding transcriptional MerR regulator